MSIVPIGQRTSLLFYVAVSVIIFFYAKYGSKEKVPTIRQLPALDAIEESIGRCTELGRPVFCEPGAMQTLSTPDLMEQTVASLNILSFVAETCAKYGCKLISCANSSETLVAQEQMQRQGYSLAGRPDIQTDVRSFLTAGCHAYQVAVGQEAINENAGAYISIGPHMTSFINTLEASARIGAMIIAGTTRTKSLSYIAPACDYTFIGEEIFAASAFLSRDPVQLNAIRGQDWCKAIVLATAVIGLVSVALGQFDQFVSLLRW